MNDRDYLEQAVDLAVENVRSGNGGPFGAILLRDRAILSRGTDLVTETNDPKAHAEIIAIRKACQELETFELDRSVLYTSCEPCPICLGAILWSRIGRVVFVADRRDAAGAGSNDEEHYRQYLPDIKAKMVQMDQILLESANRAFKVWTEARHLPRY
ncbi:MAG: nucleoside deaminase [Chlorobi bacterium]|nr:nucleoside deaminase [Chlorobiota bacterium]